MVRQCTNSRVLCCYKLEDNEVDDDEKAHLKTRLDLLLTVRHQGMRLIYEPTSPPYLFYAYCGGAVFKMPSRAIFFKRRNSRVTKFWTCCINLQACASFVRVPDRHTG